MEISKQKSSSKKPCLIFLLCAVFLTGCSTGQYDGKFVKDAKGNTFQLDWRIGQCYLLKPINVAAIDSLSRK